MMTPFHFNLGLVNKNSHMQSFILVNSFIIFNSIYILHEYYFLSHIILPELILLIILYSLIHFL